MPQTTPSNIQEQPPGSQAIGVPLKRQHVFFFDVDSQPAIERFSHDGQITRIFFGPYGGSSMIKQRHPIGIYVPEYLYKRLTSATLIFAGRYQPWHIGHHEIVRALLLLDVDVFTNESDRSMFQKLRIRSLHIAVAHQKIATDNPLSTGEARRLIEIAIANDSDLVATKTEIRVDWLPNLANVAAEHGLFRQVIPNPTAKLFFVSGNPSTLAEDETAGIPFLAVSNRENASELSATMIRRRIVENTVDSMQWVRNHLPKGVYEEMFRRRLFDRIRRLAAGG